MYLPLTKLPLAFQSVFIVNIFTLATTLLPNSASFRGRVVEQAAEARRDGGVNKAAEKTKIHYVSKYQLTKCIFFYKHY